MRYECSIWRPQRATGPPPLLLMAHKAARLLRAALAATHKNNLRAKSAIVSTMIQHPEYVHKFADNVLEADSPLLNSTQGTDLVKILSNNRIILLDPAQLDIYTESNICKAPGTIPALLRRAWYDTYSYVKQKRKIIEIQL